MTKLLAGVGGDRELLDELAATFAEEVPGWIATLRTALASGDTEVFALHAGSIDLVVTDVIMPGCGGPELLSRLQVQAPALRVLYMSGHSDQSAVHKAGIDRGLPFVQKPFTAQELVRQVRRALERSCPEEPGSTE